MYGQPFAPLAAILTDFMGFVNVIVIPALFALAFIAFLWGVYNYFFVTDKEGKDQRKKGKDFIFYGLIAFFVMLSVWGLVNILLGSLPLDNANRGTPIFNPPGNYGSPFQ